MKVWPRCSQRRINNGLIILQGQAIDRSRQAGVSKPEVGQRCRQAQGQGRQRSIIQRWGKGTGRQAGSGAGRVVRQAGSESEQARLKTRRVRKRETWKSRSWNTNAGWLDKQGELATDKQRTQVNTQWIMGKMGDTWRGVETITKTGKTDQGVTTCNQIKSNCHMLRKQQVYTNSEMLICGKRKKGPVWLSW
jgi:hypothetical protein